MSLLLEHLRADERGRIVAVDQEITANRAFLTKLMEEYEKDDHETPGPAIV